MRRRLRLTVDPDSSFRSAPRALDVLELQDRRLALKSPAAIIGLVCVNYSIKVVRVKVGLRRESLDHTEVDTSGSRVEVCVTAPHLPASGSLGPMYLLLGCGCDGSSPGGPL